MHASQLYILCLAIMVLLTMSLLRAMPRETVGVYINFFIISIYVTYFEFQDSNGWKSHSKAWTDLWQLLSSSTTTAYVLDWKEQKL